MYLPPDQPAYHTGISTPTHRPSLPPLPPSHRPPDPSTHPLTPTPTHARMQEVERHRQAMQAAVVQPQRCMAFLKPGRLVRVRVGALDWGVGVIVAVSRQPGGHGAKGAGAQGFNAASMYIVDTLLECAPGLAAGAWWGGGVGVGGERKGREACSGRGRRELGLDAVRMRIGVWEGGRRLLNCFVIHKKNGGYVGRMDRKMPCQIDL